MKRVILHIGLPKTGSSSIQASLAGVDTGAVRMARIGPSLYHNLALSTLLSDDPATMRQHRNRGRSAADVAQRRNEWARGLTRELTSATDTLILSSEVISNSTPAQLDRLVEQIEAAGRELHLFAYIRDPVSLFGSALQQRLKMFDRMPRDFDPYQYRKRLGYWTARLPGHQRTLRAFDTGQMRAGSPVRDFADFCGLPDDAYEEKRRNDSLNAEVTRLLWIFNGAMPVSTGRPRLAETRKRFLQTLKHGVPGPQFETPVACMSASKELRAELDWLAAATGVDFRDQLSARAPDMLGAPLDPEMRRLAPDTPGHVAALFLARGLPPPDGDMERVLTELYLHLLAPEPAPADARNWLTRLLRR